MRVFVTGATGFIGRAVTRELIAHGHQVVGLARSKASAAALRAAGADAHRGSVRNLESLRRGAAEADGVIHLAFTFSPADMPLARALGVLLGGAPNRIVSRMMAAVGATDRSAIDALGGALQGSGRPLVTTFATMGLADAAGEGAARPATEADAPNPRSPGFARAVNEGAVAAWAKRGVRASIVRLAPSVHGNGDKGLIPHIIRAARRSGEALYVADGAHRWCGVHRDDAAVLFRLALEKGAAGGIYHGVGDDGAPFREIGEIVGRRLGLPVSSVTLAEARRRLGFIGPFVATDNPVGSERTRRDLGWHPAGPSLLRDMDRDDYFEG